MPLIMAIQTRRIKETLVPDTPIFSQQRYVIDTKATRPAMEQREPTRFAHFFAAKIELLTPKPRVQQWSRENQLGLTRGFQFHRCFLQRNNT